MDRPTFAIFKPWRRATPDDPRLFLDYAPINRTGRFGPIGGASGFEHVLDLIERHPGVARGHLTVWGPFNDRGLADRRPRTQYGQAYPPPLRGVSPTFLN